MQHEQIIVTRDDNVGMAVDGYLEELIIIGVAASRDGFTNLYLVTNCLDRINEIFSLCVRKVLVELVAV